MKWFLEDYFFCGLLFLGLIAGVFVLFFTPPSKLSTGTAMVKEKKVVETGGGVGYYGKGIIIPHAGHKKYELILTQCKKKVCYEDSVYVDKEEYDNIEIGDEINYNPEK